MQSDIRGVLFDVDGTLIDTTYIHTLCWWQALRQSDRDTSMASVHRAIGMGSAELVSHVLGETNDDLVDDLAASHDALYAAYWPRLRRLPGAQDLVRRCHDLGLVTVLATSAARRELDMLLGVLDIDSAIDFTTSSDEADRSKPHPDIVAAALSKADLAPETAIFVGDAVWDVNASLKAGLSCIGLECGGTSAAELRDAGAVAVYRDPADLLDGLESSPLHARPNR